MNILQRLGLMRLSEQQKILNKAVEGMNLYIKQQREAMRIDMDRALGRVVQITSNEDSLRDTRVLTVHIACPVSFVRGLMGSDDLIRNMVVQSMAHMMAQEVNDVVQRGLFPLVPPSSEAGEFDG